MITYILNRVLVSQVRETRQWSKLSSFYEHNQVMIARLRIWLSPKRNNLFKRWLVLLDKRYDYILNFLTYQLGPFCCACKATVYPKYSPELPL